jgi:hypothetical protein
VDRAGSRRGSIRACCHALEKIQTHDLAKNPGEEARHQSHQDRGGIRDHIAQDCSPVVKIQSVSCAVNVVVENLLDQIPYAEHGPADHSEERIESGDRCQKRIDDEVGRDMAVVGGTKPAPKNVH